MLHWACSLLSLCICLPHLLFFCLFKPSSRQPICLTYPRMLSLGAGRGWSRVRVRSSSMTAPSMFLNLTCCFYLFFYLRSPHADRLWRENSNGILYIDLFLFLKKYNYYDYFFAMVASGHLSVGTSRIFRERKKVCVCVDHCSLSLLMMRQRAPGMPYYTQTHTHSQIRTHSWAKWKGAVGRESIRMAGMKTTATSVFATYTHTNRFTNTHKHTCRCFSFLLWEPGEANRLGIITHTCTSYWTYSDTRTPQRYSGMRSYL